MQQTSIKSRAALAPKERIRRRVPNPQVITQRAIVIEQIATRRRVHDFLARQINGQKIRAPEIDLLPCRQCAPVSDHVRRDDVLLPAQRDVVAVVEGEDDVVGDVRDAVAAVGAGCDYGAQIVDVGCFGRDGAVRGAFVIDVDVVCDGLREGVDAAGGEGVEPALGDLVGLSVVFYAVVLAFVIAVAGGDEAGEEEEEHEG